jgi:DMSO/TMAO reductase YedYZ molybdopterin-dependent catalytic subunit
MLHPLRQSKKHVIFFLIILGSLSQNFGISIKGENAVPITSNEDFFKTSIDHFVLDPESYRLEVVGHVYKPLSLTLEEIRALPVTSEIVRLTCIAYKYGASSLTGVANWTGVKLSEVLNLAQIDFDSAFDVIFRTPDHSSDGYSTSLTIEEAFWDDVILAYEMNGVPLPIDHGFPIRMVCPRFYGYKWIKWLTYIDVSDEDYLGHWESTGIYEDSPYVDLALPIYYNGTTDSTATLTKSQQLGVEFEILVLILIFSPFGLIYIFKGMKNKKRE